MKRYLPYLALWVMMLTFVWHLMPLHDDWTYLTAPHSVSLGELLPSAVFWRPFDAMWGWLMGAVPWAWPWANKLIIVSGHVVNAWLVGRIFRNCAAAIFFALSSAMAAALVNTDSINQVWSVTFGLLALAGLGKWYSSVFLFVAILLKESGIGWCAVLPLVLWGRGMPRDAIRTGLSCLGLALIYFALRYALGGAIGDETGQYALNLSLGHLVCNLAIGVVLPLSGVDALALVTRRWILFSIGVCACAIFWSFALSQAWRRGLWRDVAIAVLCALALAVPHCVTSVHPAEMHFYPVVFAGTMLVSHLDFSEDRFLRMGALMLLFAFALGWGDKIWEVHCSSNRARQMYEAGTILPEDEIDHPYSVFRQSAAHALDDGAAFTVKRR